MLVETGIIRDQRDADAEEERAIAQAANAARAEAEAAAMRESFAGLVEKARDRARLGRQRHA